jgi:hypothetical protein
MVLVGTPGPRARSSIVPTQRTGRKRPSSLPGTSAISLVLDIGQGAGLAGATGVRPFLPPLLAGALARGDIGLDFDGTGWQFLESPVFLVVVLALAVISYGAERSGANRRALARGTALLAAVLGALLFAGSLAEGDGPPVVGIVAGVACALLAYAGVGGLLERAGRRLDESAAGFLAVFADAAALVLAAISIFVPPVAFLALIAFVVLLIRGRKEGERKYAGLRILR